MAGLCFFDAFGGCSCNRDIELVVHRQLVLQRSAQILIIINEKDLACGAHVMGAPV